MDIDTGTFQAAFVGLGSAHSFGGAGKAVNNGSISLSAGGLLRYHSAPSSVLAGLLEDDFFAASEETEFAQFLSDGSIATGSFSSALVDVGAVHLQGDGSDHAREGFVSPGSVQNEQYVRTSNSLNFCENLSQNPLSAISEYGLEETVEDFCLPLSSKVVQQPGQVGATTFQPGTCGVEVPSVSFQSGLIRQSTSPAEALSRLAREAKSNQEVKLGCGLAGPHLPTREEKLVGHPILPAYQATVNNLPDLKSGEGIRISSISSPSRPVALLRHSSSPAGLLSQINLEDFAIAKDNRPLEGTAGMFPSMGASQNVKGPFFGGGHTLVSGNQGLASQAMQHSIDLGQRKRGRGSDGKLPQKGLLLQRSPDDLGNMTSSCFSLSPPSSSSPASIDCTEGATEESVLCKARAKRGCATHPRSIAERQRRIKISERMKKLQDLVPHLDKQGSTAEMLDEVVEYVKLLQRQVQELSLNPPRCNGFCQQQASVGSPPDHGTEGHL